MRALSLRQPWAQMVLHHGKTIENRRWNTKFRGLFLIHAAKGCTRAEYDGALEMLDDVNGYQPVDVIPFDTMPRGGIVGIARLVDVVHPTLEQTVDYASYYPAGVEWRWHAPEQYGFVLADVKPLPFTPLRGELGFFEVPEGIADAAARGNR